jgi:hypothetical protein
MASQITKFQMARWCVLASLLLFALTVGFVLVNRTFGFVPPSYFWWVAVPGTVLAVFGFVGYRCPNCRKFPEARDVPMFNPEKCEDCGTQLK